jgi:hypothetical protein
MLGPSNRSMVSQHRIKSISLCGVNDCLEVLHYSWSSSCGRQSVDQFVWVSGVPLGPLTGFYLVLLFSADNYLILLCKSSSLTRKRVCSLQCNHSLVPITILYRHLRLCSLYIASYDSQGYGGGILTRLHTGL